LPKKQTTLDQLRMAAGITQWQLAQQSGVAWVTIARLELGQHRPKPATYDKLASVLGDKVFQARYGWRKVYKKRGRPRKETNDDN
jgi:predicted transcriptional regulator